MASHPSLGLSSQHMPDPINVEHFWREFSRPIKLTLAHTGHSAVRRVKQSGLGSGKERTWFLTLN